MINDSDHSVEQYAYSAGEDSSCVVFLLVSISNQRIYCHGSFMRFGLDAVHSGSADPRIDHVHFEVSTFRMSFNVVGINDQAANGFDFMQ